MCLLLRKCRQLQLPVAIQLELFDILVKPILFEMKCIASEFGVTPLVLHALHE